jgi:hypothetical protein
MMRQRGHGNQAQPPELFPFNAIVSALDPFLPLPGLRATFFRQPGEDKIPEKLLQPSPKFAFAILQSLGQLCSF